MEVVIMSSSTVALEAKIWPAVVAKIALVAQKPLALLLLVVCCEISLFAAASGEDTRLPLGEVNGETKCNAENTDGSATDGTDEQGEEEDDDDDMSTDDDDDDDSTDDDDDDSDEDYSDSDDTDDSDDSDDDDDDDDDNEEDDGASEGKKDQN